MHVLTEYLDSNDATQSDASIKSLFQSLSNLEVGGTRLYDGTGTHWMQNPIEFKDLCVILRNLSRHTSYRVRNFLEVGFATGITHTILTKIFKPEYSVAIDLTSVSGGASTFVANLRFKHLIYISADSKSTFATNSASFFAPFDLIIIDGDHSYIGVKGDFENYTPMLGQKGLVVLHDVKANSPIEVKEFWDDLDRKDFQLVTLFDTSATVPYGMGLVFFGFDDAEIRSALMDTESATVTKLESRRA